jgi:hypothetical protein
MVFAPAWITASKMRHQEVQLGAAGVLGGELDVVGVLARPADGLHRLLDDLVGRHAQLLLHVDRAGGDEGVDAAGLGRLDGLAGAADVVLVGARQRADGGLLDRLGDRADRLEVAGRGGGEAGLDDVDRMRSSWRAMRSFSSGSWRRRGSARRRARSCRKSSSGLSSCPSPNGKRK